MAIEHLTAASGLYRALSYQLSRDFNGANNGVYNGVKRSNGKSIEDKIDEGVRIGVVIVDMQKHFLKNIHRKKRKEIITQQKKILECCSHHDIPVIRLQLRRYGETIPELERYLIRIPRSVKHWKDYEDGFDYPAYQFNEWGIEYLFFMGVNADACVLTNAKIALAKGFRVFTSEEVIAQPQGWNSESFSRYRRWFGDNGRIYLDKTSYLEKGRIVCNNDTNNRPFDRLARRLCI